MDTEQRKRFNKIYNEEFYLLDKKNMTFSVSGSTANIYKVKITSSTIYCDCPDSKSWAKKYGCVCKHCCFILHKVLKEDIIILFDKESYERIKMKCDKIDIFDDEFVNKELLQKFNNLSLIKFDEIKGYDEDEECVICSDLLKDTKLISCPTCHHNIHEKCMKKWIENGKTSCVYCRSDVWKNYMKSSSNTYVNLS